MQQEKYVFSKLRAENEAGRLVPDLFLFFKRALYELKESSIQLSFNIFRWCSTWQTSKTNCIKL